MQQPISIQQPQSQQINNINNSPNNQINNTNNININNNNNYNNNNGINNNNINNNDNNNNNNNDNNNNNSLISSNNNNNTLISSNNNNNCINGNNSINNSIEINDIDRGEKKANKLIAKTTKKFNKDMTAYTSGKFFELWRNQVVRDKILGYVRIHNLHYDKRVFKCIDLNNCIDNGADQQHNHRVHNHYHHLGHNYFGKVSRGIISLSDYKYYGYLRSVHLIGYEHHEEELIKTMKSLPIGVNTLELSGHLNKIIFKEGSLPTSITSLTISSPTKIGYKSIASHLKTLKLNSTFNDPLLVQGRLEGQLGIVPLLPIDGAMTSLDTGSKFNQPFEAGLLPSSLTELTFGNEYFRPIEVGSLPSGIKSLKLGQRFCLPIPIGSLPIGLTELQLGGTQQNPILTIGCLPPTLTKLTLDNHFNQPLAIGVIPSSLKTMIFGPRYNQPLPPSVFPDSLTHLEFHQNSSYIFPLKLGYNIPSNVTTLLLSFRSQERNVTLGTNSNIKKLRCGGEFLPSLSSDDSTIGAILNSFSSSSSRETFPRSVESLHLNIVNVLDKEINIPSNVTKLIITGNNLQSDGPDIFMVGKKGSKITHLKLRGYEKPLCQEMFKNLGNLKSIQFIGAYNHQLKSNCLPHSITNLEFDCLPTVIPIGSLPSSLKSLRVKSFCTPFLQNSLPQSLLILECAFIRSFIDSYEIVDEVFVEQQALYAQQQLLQNEQALQAQKQLEQQQATQQRLQQLEQQKQQQQQENGQLDNSIENHNGSSSGGGGIQEGHEENDQEEEENINNHQHPFLQEAINHNQQLQQKHQQEQQNLYNNNNNNNTNEEDEEDLTQPIISKEWLPPFIHTLIIRGEPTIQLPLPESLTNIHIESKNQSILHNIPLMNQISKLVRVFDYESDTNSIFKKSLTICNNINQNNSSKKKNIKK
ncbi:hypothetical protein ACTFIU_004074 [Dictyostelium citrinum]